VQRLRVRLSTADAFIRAGVHKNVLVIGAEVFSRILDFNDRTTCVLFGDGAGAVVLAASRASWPPRCTRTAAIRTSCACRAPWRRHRRRSVSVHGRPGRVQAGRIGAGKSGAKRWKSRHAAEQIDWLIPHQANIRIMSGTAKKLGLPMEKMVVTVDQHGNTSAASIPLALDAVRDGRIKPGQNIMMEGVGGGFTWGAVLASF
jgi:3-oxoacyl-[acyl-carrier-protein] synthase-3